MFPKPLVVGAPRSGFSLLIAVCNTILRMLKADQKRNVRDVVIQALVQLMSYYIKDQYFKTFKELGIEREVVFNGEFHLLVGGPKWLNKEDPDTICVRKYIGIKGKGDFLFITTHPKESLEYHLVLHSHETPRLWLETPYYDQFVKMAPVRNPIGIINSSSFSLNAMASEYLQKFLPNEDAEIIRQRHGAYKLTDMDFVRGLIKYLQRYLDEFLEVKDRYFRVYPSFSKGLLPEITNFCQSRLTCNAMDLSSLIMERVNKNDYRDNRSCLRAKGDDPMMF